MLNRKFATLFVLLAGFMGLLSDRSGYSLTSDVESINWEIALMLSPSGLLRAFLVQPDFYLRSYYSEISARGELFRDPVLMGLLVCVGLTALSGLILFRLSILSREEMK